MLCIGVVVDSTNIRSVRYEHPSSVGIRHRAGYVQLARRHKSDCPAAQEEG